MPLTARARKNAGNPGRSHGGGAAPPPQAACPECKAALAAADDHWCRKCGCDLQHETHFAAPVPAAKDGTDDSDDDDDDATKVVHALGALEPGEQTSKIVDAAMRVPAIYRKYRETRGEEPAEPVREPVAKSVSVLTDEARAEERAADEAQGKADAIMGEIRRAYPTLPESEAVPRFFAKHRDRWREARAVSFAPATQARETLAAKLALDAAAPLAEALEAEGADDAVAKSTLVPGLAAAQGRLLSLASGGASVREIVAKSDALTALVNGLATAAKDYQRLASSGEEPQHVPFADALERVLDDSPALQHAARVGEDGSNLPMSISEMRKNRAVYEAYRRSSYAGNDDEAA